MKHTAYPMKEEILAHISRGDTGQAIETLIRGLTAESKPANAAFIRTARLIESEHARLREEQLANILQPDAATAQLNAINRRILELLDAMDKPKPGNSGMRRTLIAAVAGLTLLLTALIFGKDILARLAPEPSVPPGIASATYSCPNFSTDKKLKIAVLPFLNLFGDGGIPLHIGLQDELNALLNRTQYSGQAATTSGNPEKNYLNFDEAEKLRRECDADMVIWGKYAKTNTGDMQIDIRFVSPQLAMSQNADLDSLLEHRTQAELSSNLKISALLLLAQALLAEQQYELAMRLANQAILSQVANAPEAESVHADAHIIIAEAYQMMGQSDQAAENYKKVLDVQPTNEVALNNKVVLDLKAKRYVEAQELISKAIEEHPDKTRLETIQRRIDRMPASGDTVFSKELIRDLRILRKTN